jgi:transcriptional regulator with XRE-family HTH domain
MSHEKGAKLAKATRKPAKPPVASRPELRGTLDGLVARIDARHGNNVFGASLRAGNLVRRMRSDAGLSQRALGKAIGVSQARISEIEVGAGAQGPTWALMERILAACGCTISVVPTAVAVGGEIQTASALIPKVREEDVLDGSAENDALYGSSGTDVLTGGSETDWFAFSLTGAADKITDFRNIGDSINLLEIGSLAGSADNAFNFTGLGAFSGTAGELAIAHVGKTNSTRNDLRKNFDAFIAAIVTTKSAGGIKGSKQRYQKREAATRSSG